MNLLDSYLSTIEGSPNTRLAIRRDVGALLAFCDPLKATEADLRAFFTREARRLSDHALYIRWLTSRGFFSWLLAAGYVPQNPMEGIARPRSQPRRLVDTAIVLRDEAIRALHYEEGLVTPTIARLRLRSLDGKVLETERGPHTLGGKTVKVLRAYLQMRPELCPRDDSLFVTRNGKPLSREGIRNICRKPPGGEAGQ